MKNFILICSLLGLSAFVGFNITKLIDEDNLPIKFFNSNGKYNSNFNNETDNNTSNEKELEVIEKNKGEVNAEDENNDITTEVEDETESKTETSTSQSNTNKTQNKPNNNKKPNTGNNTQSKPDPSTPAEAEKPTFAKLALSGSGNENITISQNGNNFVLTGSMNEKEKINEFNSGSYVKLKITAPKIYSVEELNKMSVKLLYSGITYTQAGNSVLENVSSNSLAYFYLSQEFMYGKKISIVVDWGDGKVITYNFTFNIDVIKN